MEALSDDFYAVIRPLFLIKQYRRALEVKEQLVDFVAKN